MFIAAGGFDLSGIPELLLQAIKKAGTKDLTFASNIPLASMCGRVCVAEVEVDEIVPRGTLDPDAIHLPGIYVHRLIQGAHEKRIEQRTVRRMEAV